MNPTRSGRVARVVAVASVIAVSASTSFAQDMKDLLEEQRRMRELLDAQARKIEDLQHRLDGPAAAPAPASSSVSDAVEQYLAAREAKGSPFSGFTKSKSKFTVYGFLRLDAVRDDSRPNNTQLPGWILSEDATAGIRKNAEDFTMHPRLTRLGIDFDGGTVEALDGAAVAGKIEVDFYGAGSESRAGLRMRHAYLTLKKDAWQLLAGQTQDLIAPLNPIVNNDLVMWGAGNLGDRRPQLRLEYDPKVECGQLFFQSMLGLTSAIDAKDLDANTYRDGESSGRPTLQARVAYRYAMTDKSNLEVGVWAHNAKDDPDTPVAGKGSFDSRAYGFDVTVPILGDQLWVKAEGWTGKNLTDVRGGIFQGVDATTGEEIDAQGGFAELGYKVTKVITAYGGVSVDNPRNHDLTAGGRSKNEVEYLALRFDLNPIELGLEYLHWTTEYIGLDDGTDNRVGAFIAYKF